MVGWDGLCSLYVLVLTTLLTSRNRQMRSRTRIPQKSLENIPISHCCYRSIDENVYIEPVIRGSVPVTASSSINQPVRFHSAARLIDRSKPREQSGKK